MPLSTPVYDNMHPFIPFNVYLSIPFSMHLSLPVVDTEWMNKKLTWTRYVSTFYVLNFQNLDIDIIKYGYSCI